MQFLFSGLTKEVEEFRAKSRNCVIIFTMKREIGASSSISLGILQSFFVKLRNKGTSEHKGTFTNKGQGHFRTKTIMETNFLL